MAAASASLRASLKRVALGDGEAGRRVERRDVDGVLEAVLRRVLLGRLVVEEVGVDGAAVHRRDGGVVVGEAHESVSVKFFTAYASCSVPCTTPRRLPARSSSSLMLASGRHHGEVAGEVAVGEVDGLLALVGDADGGDADVELPVGDRGEQAGEVLAGEHDVVDADALGDIREELDIEAGELALSSVNVYGFASPRLATRMVPG